MYDVGSFVNKNKKKKQMYDVGSFVCNGVIVTFMKSVYSLRSKTAQRLSHRCRLF